MRADPFALGDHDPRWLEAACAPRAWRDASRLYRFADGGEVVLPLVERTAGPLRVGSSYPRGLGFGGPVGADISPQRMQAIVRNLTEEGWVDLRIRPNPLHPAAAPGSLHDLVHEVVRTAHILDLRRGSDAVWAGIQKSRRRRIRRAESLGVEVEVASSPRGVEEFERLWRLSVVRWASDSSEPLWLARARSRVGNPIGQLRRLAEHLGDDLRLWLASVDGRVVAANVVVLGPNAHATRAAMDRVGVGSTGAPELLEWSSITEAIARGCSFYNMGDSGAGSSLGRYKEGFGAEPHNYAEWRLERLPISRTDRAMRSAIKRVVGFRD